MSKHFLNRLLGNWGSCFLSVAGALAVLSFNKMPLELTGEILFEILLIRVLYAILITPGNHFTAALAGKSLWNTIRFEMRITVAFLAACYLLSWDVSMSVAIQIVTVNYVLQFLWGVSAIALLNGKLKILSADGRLISSKRAMIIGTGNQAKQAADLILNNINLDTDIIGFVDDNRTGLWSYRDIPLIGGTKELEKFISRSHVDYVILAVETDTLPNTAGLVESVEKMGISVLVMTEFYQPTVARLYSATSGNQLIAEFSTVKHDGISLLLKSILDRIGALIGIIVASPIMFLTAILIKLDSKGPILFKQIRTGHNGKTFKLWKFRTMVLDAEMKREELKEKNEMSGPVFKIAQDPRVTGIGRFLRKYSIDELPQLFNVMFGEMSLVGPRPPLPKEVKEFKPWQHRKLSVKPGLTCLWQTNGRNNIDFEEWMKLDLKYIDNWSLWEDAKIIVRTVPTVLRGTGS